MICQTVSKIQPLESSLHDDSNLTAVGETLGEAEKKAGVDLGNVQKWLSPNKLISLNIAKTEYILIASRHMANKMDVLPIQ